MKYIRTKDGIFEVYKETENGYNINTKPFLTTKKTRYYLSPFISKEKIINQADSIEELCDEFVIFAKEEPNGKLIYTLGFENLKREIVDFETSKKYLIIYGAIWTDKGLIYVAKMNEKGELELL